jgi:short-subunit dehydrogenase
MPQSRFHGKVVWITGASGGLGEALARRFARCGSRLVLTARRVPELQRVASLCSGAASVRLLPADLSRPELLAEKVHSVLEGEGRVDVMVHNAAVGQRAFAADTGFEVDDLIMRTNFLGPVALTKPLLVHMRARGAGHFIVVTSILGKFGLPGRSSYCASKHALHGFFDTVRAENSPYNIEVTLALPGWVRTNMSMNALTGNGEPQRRMDRGTASGVTPEFCAQKIVSGAERGKAEVLILRFQEHAALQFSRFAPGLFRRIVRGRPV